ncbi:MAG: NAD(P)/FAD-dependent oxidoreductase [Acidimicrobiales bacterium]|nr:NAD(P)/FAD-dependent oxidoreductase [Acidimicrobiales bacterium]
MAATEHLDVLVVGAGLSGVCAGHYLQTETPWASYAIFEARSAIGGTWDLFRYPGVRSDSDMFTLGYPFRPWKSSQMIVDGDAIRGYIEDTAAEEGIDEHIRFQHRIVRADWSSDDARWHVVAERTDTDETVELTCGFLFSCSGYYRYDHGYQPDFPGADRFQGDLVHPQHWPEDLEIAGKKAVVIGSGATAVTLVPSLAERGADVTMLQRSPTYIASVPGENPVVGAVQRVLPEKIAGSIVRWAHALGAQGMYELSQRYPGPVRRLLRFGVRMQLPRGYDIDTHFNPDYDPWDERMCAVPGGDLFKAIKSGKATVVTDHIDTFTETGIRLRSGEELEADIVVSATGLELLFLGGIELSVDGEPVELKDQLTYKGMMLEGVPNLALAIGYTNASWTLRCDLTCQYVMRLLNRLRDSGLRQCTPVNDDPSVQPEPLLNLRSGYVQRAQGRMPQQGSQPPWRVYQSYLQDYRSTRRADVDDGVMTFTNPVDAAERGRRVEAT